MARKEETKVSATREQAGRRQAEDLRGLEREHQRVGINTMRASIKGLRAPEIARTSSEGD